MLGESSAPAKQEISARALFDQRISESLCTSVRPANVSRAR
jgi:hypothetical protein